MKFTIILIPKNHLVIIIRRKRSSNSRDSKKIRILESNSNRKNYCSREIPEFDDRVEIELVKLFLTQEIFQLQIRKLLKMQIFTIIRDTAMVSHHQIVYALIFRSFSLLLVEFSSFYFEFLCCLHDRAIRYQSVSPLTYII